MTAHADEVVVVEVLEELAVAVDVAAVVVDEVAVDEVLVDELDLVANEEVVVLVVTSVVAAVVVVVPVVVLLVMVVVAVVVALVDSPGGPEVPPPGGAPGVALDDVCASVVEEAWVVRDVPTAVVVVLVAVLVLSWLFL